jgi:hypothetical protein
MQSAELLSAHCQAWRQLRYSHRAEGSKEQIVDAMS